MGENLEVQIRKLQELYWSEYDPEGRRFVPLAELFRRTGDVSEARRILRDGLSRHAQMASGHVVLGWVLLDQGDAAEAEASFRAALAVDPRNICALKGLGDLLVGRGDVMEALEVHKALHYLDPLDEEVPQRLAELEARLETLARTPEVHEPAATPEAGEAPSVWGDGEEVAESLDWDDAFIQADRSLEERAGFRDFEEEPPAPESLPQEAGSDPVPALGPASGKDALVTRTMGEIYLRQGLLDEARSVFRDLLEQNPGDEILQARLQEVEDQASDRESGKIQGTAPRPPSLPTGDIGDGPKTAPPVGASALETVTPVADPGPDAVVPVADLAPGAVVLVGDLAPDSIVPIQDLAPDSIVPIQDLAPDSSTEDSDSTLDAFGAWLDNLP
ncbi:MAG: tetratricopeptide repeat protein [Longimicrobiales bacterium]